jgi:hypothetical protein
MAKKPKHAAKVLRRMIRDTSGLFPSSVNVKNNPEKPKPDRGISEEVCKPTPKPAEVTRGKEKAFQASYITYSYSAKQLEAECHTGGKQEFLILLLSK